MLLDSFGHLPIQAAVEVEFVLKGVLPQPAFLAFVQHRSACLSLEPQVDKAERDEVILRVKGVPDILDAFELACSLGPVEARVTSVSSVVVADAVEPGLLITSA